MSFVKKINTSKSKKIIIILLLSAVCFFQLFSTKHDNKECNWKYSEKFIECLNENFINKDLYYLNLFMTSEGFPKLTKNEDKGYYFSRKSKGGLSKYGVGVWVWVDINKKVIEIKDNHRRGN